MIAKVIQIGNSKGIRIPSQILKEMNIEEEILLARKKAARLIDDCLTGGKPVREALKEWPNTKYDKSIACAKHALIHYEADEDFRIGDPAYQDSQIEWLENIIKILSNGEALPINIIKSYEEYYPHKLDIVSTLSYYYFCCVVIIRRIKSKLSHK